MKTRPGPVLKAKENQRLCVWKKLLARCSVNDALAIDCPHCGETFSLAFDVTEGSAEFIADCEICCRPMVIAVRVVDGAIDGVEVMEC